MKIKGLLLGCLMAIGLSSCVYAGDTIGIRHIDVISSGDYKYILLDDGTASICNYVGGDTNIEIPESIDGKEVTGIGLKTTYDYISEEGVWECENLTSIKFPDTIKSAYCNPFSKCNAEFIVSPDHPYLAVKDGVLFSKPDKRLICCPTNKESYEVPEGVRSIGNFAFNECGSLAEITLPETLESIGDMAFAYCESLARVVLPESINYVGVDPFVFCDYRSNYDADNIILELVVSPDHPYLAMIDGALYSKPDKRLIYCPFNKDKLEVPDGIQIIGDVALCGNTELSSISLPDSVTRIGSFAFCQTCFTNITLPEELTYIGEDAFFWTNLTTINLPKGITYIGENAFTYSDVTITVTRDTYAAQYCKDNGLNYTYPDIDNWLYE